MGGVPLYALDRHTRLGKQALATFAQENLQVRRVIQPFVVGRTPREAIAWAAFYADGAAVGLRLCWRLSRPIEALGIENDLLKAGIPTEGHAALLAVVRANLDHLNSIRTRLLQARGLPAATDHTESQG